MGLKTVIRRLISKYGIMSIEMQGAGLATALSADKEHERPAEQNVTPLEEVAEAQMIEAEEFPEETSAPPEADPLEGINF